MGFSKDREAQHAAAVGGGEKQKDELAALDKTAPAAEAAGRTRVGNTLAAALGKRGRSVLVLQRMAAGIGAPVLPSNRVKALVEALRKSKLFDAKWYASEYPEILAAKVDLLEHYVRVGSFADYDPNPYFFNRWYRVANPDMAADDNPLAHFLARPRGDKAFPNPFFDVDFYLEANPDIAEAGVEPLWHYIEFGAAEGRRVNPLLDLDEYAQAERLENGKGALRHLLRVTLPSALELPGKPAAAVRALLDSGLFDTKLYLALAPEAELFPLDPAYDYHLRGWRLGKSAHVLFDPAFYLASNPDVAAALVDPLLHFVEYRAKEERAPHPLFDIESYFAHYNDVRDLGMNPLLHYLMHGWKSRYLPNPFFDSAWYLETYCAGLQRVNPLLDYLRFGKAAGRRPHPDFDPAHYLAANPDIAERAAGDPYVFFVAEGHLDRMRETAPGKRLAHERHLQKKGRTAPPQGIVAALDNAAGTRLDLQNTRGTRARYDEFRKNLDATSAAFEHVGGGDFEMVGLQERLLLDRYAPVHDGETLVDVGCGPGRLARYLVDRRIKYVGIDVVPDLLDVAEEQCGRGDWKFMPTDGPTIPLPDKSADVIAILGVFTNMTVENSYLLFLDASRVLKAGGRLFVTYFDIRYNSRYFKIYAPTAEKRFEPLGFLDDRFFEFFAKEANLEIMANEAPRSIDIDRPMTLKDGRTVTESIPQMLSLALFQKRVPA